MLTFGAVRSLPRPGRPAAARRGDEPSPRSSTRCWRPPGASGSAAWCSSSTPTTRDLPARRRGGAACRRSSRAGIDVVDVLRADGGRWCRVPARPGPRETGAVAVRRRAPPVRGPGRVRGSGDPRQPRRAARHPGRPTGARWSGVAGRVLAGSLPPGAERRRRGCATWSRAASRRGEPTRRRASAAARAPGGDPGRRPRCRARTRSTRDAAADHLRGLGRRCCGVRPTPQVPDAAAVAAFAAWLAGHGALAWCAVDRCLEVDPDHRLGRCLAECLTRAVPPTAWEEVGDAQPRTGSA